MPDNPKNDNALLMIPGGQMDETHYDLAQRCKDQAPDPERIVLRTSSLTQRGLSGT